MKYPQWLKRIVIIALIALSIGLSSLGVVLLVAKLSPPPALSVPQTSVVLDIAGNPIGERTPGGITRYWTALADIDQDVVQATLAAEDAHFYEHNGFHYSRIAAAAIANLKAMAKVQGASTITQQYARNLFGDMSKTWSRKLREAYVTLQLEMHYSKDEILEGYLNTIYYGHGIYGIEAAARFYFGTSADDLTIAQASLLAGIPKGPGFYSPKINMENAKKRQAYVLSQMVSAKVIDASDAQLAAEKVLHFAPKKEDIRVAPYFQDTVYQQLSSHLHLTERQVKTGGLRIYTTLDSNLQKIAEKAVAENLSEESKIQAAVVIMEPKTGSVKALVGGRDYQESSFNRAIQAQRSPGSTFKPILYYTALQNGFTPATRLMSEPTAFPYDEGREVYRPGNYNGYYAHRPITMAQALALSDNIYAVKTGLFLGTDQLIQTAKKMGIDSPLKSVPSLSLGTSAVNVLEMTEGYSVFATNGRHVPPQFITRVENAAGEVIYEAEPTSTQVLDKDLAFLTTHMMTGIFDDRLNGYTTVTGRDLIPLLTRPYAGKTGTTNADSWMIGFSPQLVTSVWLGYDEGKTMDIPSEKAAPKYIWADIMEQSHKGRPLRAFQPTEDTVPVAIDPESGLRATSDCPVQRVMYFEEGTAPQGYCSLPTAKKANESPLLPVEEPKPPWWEQLWPF
ncbi:transglycosylase domain-containing protein [Aureibacillus halotolerans]|uniref:1A family penicillin-binding protein n=1 Tax=Aureibacillus halotolerans TaxID=1508390 RepID=A0A4R6U2U5_9BACI|nr:PBP1A family penicillin-binding protein [Aureibacillus halotolerans]TDQ38769.1 1A family penicillin-binding protein [Aureibacillus halotolerans]